MSAQRPFAFDALPLESPIQVVDLNGAWQFRATSQAGWMPARVPGTVHLDLIAAGCLEDPFYRDNELKVQWVEKEDWEYRRSFLIDDSMLAHDQVYLECLGLDTIADIYINGVPLGSTENMFLEYEFKVLPLLHSGTNEIRIVFRSILEWCRQQVAREPRVTWNDEKGVSFFARKSGTNFGWDWGPRLLTCGIWRPTRLAAYDSGRITDLRIRQSLADPARALLEVHAAIEPYAEKNLLLDVEVSLDGEVVSSTSAPVQGKEASTKLVIESPRLWWPNGWGDQPLYSITANLVSGTQVVHSRQVRIGLRTVELALEKDERGQTFGFRINGRDIFCKGANWVPADAMLNRLTEENYHHLLQSCRDTHMNMLRVWGGGIYEADCFYDACDELGILVWQDFMFACGPYIANPAFIENVSSEIASVVRRLRHHPSIVLWCGNNEQESDLPDKLRQHPSLPREDFTRIFYEVIPQTAGLYDSERPYWPGSPHHPLDQKGEKPGFEKTSGDAHTWEVWHSEQPFSWFAENPGFRFVSEFGIYSLPTMETVRSFTGEEDRYFISRILDLHNKTGKKSSGTERAGNTRIARYAASMYRLPKRFDDWIYLSQVMHGEAVKTAVEVFRSHYPETRGALYWQLNENWPTISGSSIDYAGRWKALQYMARRFFNPVLVCGQVQGVQVELYGVNDLLTDLPARLEWSLARFDGARVQYGALDVLLAANASQLLARLDFTDLMGDDLTQVTYRNSNFACRSQFYLAYQLVQDEQVITSNVSFFALPRYLTLQEPGLNYSLKEINGRSLVVISSERFAMYVEVGLRQGYARFSDNYFHLLPGEKKEIEVLEVSLPGGQSPELFARSLFNTYQ